MQDSDRECRMVRESLNHVEVMMMVPEIVASASLIRALFASDGLRLVDDGVIDHKLAVVDVSPLSRLELSIIAGESDIIR